MSSACAMTVLNALTVAMLMCKCQIQIMIRKITTKGITLLCQRIYNTCIIAINQQINNVDVSLCYKLIVYMTTLIDQMDLL